MYVWEFYANFVDNMNKSSYQKYKVEFKDSLHSGKSTVIFNDATLLYKTKM